MAPGTEFFLFLPEQEFLPGLMAVMAAETVTVGNRLMNASDGGNSCTGCPVPCFFLAAPWFFFNRLSGSLVVTVQA